MLLKAEIISNDKLSNVSCFKKDFSLFFCACKNVNGKYDLLGKSQNEFFKSNPAFINQEIYGVFLLLLIYDFEQLKLSTVFERNLIG